MGDLPRDLVAGDWMVLVGFGMTVVGISMVVWGALLLAIGGKTG